MEQQEFELNYSSATPQERKKVEEIRKFYLPLDERERKFQRLQQLDGRVKSVPMVSSIMVYVVGILTFGAGMSFVFEWKKYVAGGIIGVLGMGIIAVGVWLYKVLKARMKKRYSAEILRISEELLADGEHTPDEQ